MLKRYRLLVLPISRIGPGIDSASATSNLPLRSGKASIYEGGTREPGIVVWPRKTKPGTTSDALLQSVDWYHPEICGGGRVGRLQRERRRCRGHGPSGAWRESVARTWKGFWAMDVPLLLDENGVAATSGWSARDG